MSKQGKNALDKKMKMQERIKKMEDEIKQYEEKAQIELGKYLLKEWEIKDDYTSKMVFDVIKELKNEAKELLKKNEDDMGKSDI